MRYISLCFTFLLIGMAQLMAQRNFATFIRSDVTDDKAEITYKVPAGRIYFVSLETNDENIIPRTTIGLGEVSGATYMTITWYYADDGYDRAQVERLNFSVIALSAGKLPNSPETPKPPKESGPPTGGGGNGLAFAGLGGMGLGAGMGVFGLIQYGQANELYDVYKDNLDPEAVPFTVTSRDQYYQDANDKYLTSQLLMFGGGGLILIGGALLVLNKRNNGNASRVQLQPWENLAELQLPDPPMGVGLKIRF